MPGRRGYPTDLSDAEWELVEPLVPPVKPGGRLAVHPRREIDNALAYWLRAGCAWRLLPHDLPPWQTACHYWRTWRIEGSWEQTLAVLRERGRAWGSEGRCEPVRAVLRDGEPAGMGRETTPSATILSMEGAKTTEKGGCT